MLTDVQKVVLKTLVELGDLDWDYLSTDTEMNDEELEKILNEFEKMIEG